MAKALPDFVLHVIDMMSPLGDVRAKRMFGGVGISLDDAMLALIVNGMLYFKVDDENEPAFSERALGRFVYQPKDRGPVAMSFCAAPTEVLDDRRAMLEWALPALRAAERARTLRTAKKSKRGRSTAARKVPRSTSTTRA
jgi:DNA transformation protein